MSDQPKLPPGWEDEDSETLVSDVATMVAPADAAPMKLYQLLKHRLADECQPLKPDTIAHYERCLRQFGQHLGRLPTTDDLTKQALIGWAVATREAGLSPVTGNARIKQLRALWEWGHREGLIATLPPKRLKIHEERPTPDQWTSSELAKLFEATRKLTGYVGPHKASDFAAGVLWLAYNTGERSGSIWQMTPDMLDLSLGEISVPATIRKESRVPMRWILSPRGLEALEAVAARSDGLLFTTPWAYTSSWARVYNRVLEAAGIPVNRRNGLQKMRRTVATHIKIRGGDASVWLGHAPKTVAEGHYYDRWAIQQAQRAIWPTDSFDGIEEAGSRSDMKRRRTIRRRAR